MDENRVGKFLEDHGIKGQRRGIRRTPEQLSRKVSRLKKKNTKIEQKSIDKEKKRKQISIVPSIRRTMIKFFPLCLMR